MGIFRNQESLTHGADQPHYGINAIMAATFDKFYKVGTVIEPGCFLSQAQYLFGRAAREYPFIGMFGGPELD